MVKKQDSLKNTVQIQVLNNLLLVYFLLGSDKAGLLQREHLATEHRLELHILSGILLDLFCHLDELKLILVYEL